MRSAILKMQGINADILPEDRAQKLLKSLIKESEQEQGYKSETKESSCKDPLLTKYFFIMDQGNKKSTRQTKNETFDGTADMNGRQVKTDELTSRWRMKPTVCSRLKCKG